jgi:hypothetical protein
MGMPNPPNPVPPVLEDPLYEREIFASEVVGVGSLHGNLAITLASLRFDDPIDNETPKARRIVTARLILTTPAAGQLLRSLQGLALQLEAAAAGASGKNPN